MTSEVGGMSVTLFVGLAEVRRARGVCMGPFVWPLQFQWLRRLSKQNVGVHSSVGCSYPPESSSCMSEVVGGQWSEMCVMCVWLKCAGLK